MNISDKKAEESITNELTLQNLENVDSINNENSSQDLSIHERTESEDEHPENSKNEQNQMLTDENAQTENTEEKENENIQVQATNNENESQAVEEQTSQNQISEAQNSEKANIPITDSQNKNSSISVDVDRNTVKEPKKFSIGKFLFKCLFFIFLLIILISGVYLKFSQINYMQYQSSMNNSFISQLFKVQSSENFYESKISTTNFNKWISDSNKMMHLPFGLKATNIFYDNATSKLIVNIDNSFISTSLLLNVEYFNDGLHVSDMKLGFASIPFRIGNSFIQFNDISEKINQSDLIDIEEINFSTDGVYIKYQLNDNSIMNIKNSLNRLQRNNIKEYASIKQNSELSKILYFTKKITDSKHVISDQEFILNMFSDKEFCIDVFATLDRSSANTFIDDLKREIGFDNIFDEYYFNEIVDISNYKHSFYLKDLEVHKLMQSLDEQLKSYEQIKEEKKNLVEKLDIYMIPEVATWNSILTSSFYRNEKDGYVADNMDDNDDSTYWATDVNNGIGETITFESSSSYDISNLKIKNGILSDKPYYDNHRIQRILFEFSNGNSKIIELDDRNNDYQEFSINEDNITWIKATILKIKNGNLQNHLSDKPLTGITEIHFELKKKL